VFKLVYIWRPLEVAASKIRCQNAVNYMMEFANKLRLLLN